MFEECHGSHLSPEVSPDADPSILGTPHGEVVCRHSGAISKAASMDESDSPAFFGWAAEQRGDLHRCGGCLRARNRRKARADLVFPRVKRD